MSLPPLHPSDVPGISYYVDERRNRYRVQFYKKGHKKKTLTLSTIHPRAAQKEFDDLAREWGKTGPSMFEKVNPTIFTLRGAVDLFIADCEKRHQAASTLNQRKDVLYRMADAFPGAALTAPTALTLRDFYSAPHLAPASRASYFAVIRTFFNWCIERGMIEKSPLHGIPKPKVPKKIPEHFTPVQFRVLMAYVEKRVADEPHNGDAEQALDYPDLIRFAVLTGLRITEQLSIRWMDANLTTGHLLIRAYEDRRRGIKFELKDKEERVVPLAPEALAILQRRTKDRKNDDDSEPIFCNLQGRRRGASRMSKTFKEYVKAAEGVPSHLCWHDLRHTFASWLVSGGANIAVVSAWLGHADISTTMRSYAALMPSALQWTGSQFHAAAFSGTSTVGLSNGTGGDGAPPEA